MGASGWEYFVPYQADVGKAFAELQRQVLADGDYYQGEKYDSLAELVAAKQQEEFWEEGTHSILDMHRVNHAFAADETGQIRELSPVEVDALLGSETPTRADFEQVDEPCADFDSWQGRYTVLYQDGQPHELVFWGYSGD
ncbi:hypothetical protein [Actinophytocola sp.]|uniref:hypothetical protein n=1 Tax=Actinophytocola sp. TaxID=1872138 RepID=UPI002D80CE4E|nr:hypothetical protein [Actinophytocola sp.]HET9144297.1 hypothetical protein [Actinophytocola sp.]